MLDFLTQGIDMLVNPFYNYGIIVWNLMMQLVGLTARQTPEAFSGITWEYAADVLYPITAAIGATLLNLSFYIGYIRQASDLKRGMTAEALVEVGIKVVAANSLLLLGEGLMEEFFSISSVFSGLVFEDMPMLGTLGFTDIGSQLFFMFFGFIFFIVCLVCAGSIFLTVYGRYLQMYLLVGAAPIALSTIPAGGGMAQTAYAWVRTFFAKTFEVVVIITALVIGNKMCSAINFGNFEQATGLFSGMVQALQQMFTMVFLSASVKGADTLMRRTFGL